MGFRTKLVSAVLASVLSLGIFQLFGLEWVIRHYENTLVQHRAETLAAVRTRLAESLENLDTATLNLSKPREIVNALAVADNEALYDWSRAFVGAPDAVRRIDTIGFVDPRGMVIARAPDEFRFGDDLSASRAFRGAERDGGFFGVAVVDGRPSLAAARTLRKYDDMPVGVVFAATAITPEMLAAVAGSANVAVTYSDSVTRISSNPAWRDAKATPIPFAGTGADGGFALVFLPDEAHANLLNLKTWLTGATVIASLATVLMLLALLRHHLKPYDTIIGGMLEYANQATSLFALRNRLEPVRGSGNEAAAKVTRALIRMIDSLETSFKRIEEHAASLEALARADSLTTLNNRRAMDEALEAQIHRLRRYGQRFSVIISDIDHFKSVNDSFGHPVGDRVLHRVADVLHGNSRVTDMIGRWGGEEFLLLCPNTGLDAANTHAEKLRAALEATVFAENLRITASFGVAECTPADTPATLVARADQALYAAKADGRNAVRSDVPVTC